MSACWVAVKLLGTFSSTFAHSLELQTHLKEKKHFIHNPNSTQQTQSDSVDSRGITDENKTFNYIQVSPISDSSSVKNTSEKEITNFTYSEGKTLTFIFFSSIIVGYILGELKSKITCAYRRSTLLREIEILQQIEALEKTCKKSEFTFNTLSRAEKIEFLEKIWNQPYKQDLKGLDIKNKDKKKNNNDEQTP
jgi:hypothetical protein